MLKVQLLVLMTVMVAVAGVTAQVPQPAPGTYAWHGELVGMDPGSATLKVRVLPGTETQVKAFKAGERVLLTWSGFDVAAHAVRAVARYDAAAATKADLILPAELVSPVVQDQYVTVKVRVPSIPASVKSLKPGEWVTVTARHKPTSDAQAIVNIAPYVTDADGPGN